ncbi:hypothetical protein [Streptomyces synnematoformans]|uniref:Uncharacterized protein n=1 Tax=Streptomyces synnematoformans TaxID=415721 RepID=A0ABN2XW78_9ACTN
MTQADRTYVRGRSLDPTAPRAAGEDDLPHQRNLPELPGGWTCFKSEPWLPMKGPVVEGHYYATAPYLAWDLRDEFKHLDLAKQLMQMVSAETPEALVQKVEEQIAIHDTCCFHRYTHKK